LPLILPIILAAEMLSVTQAVDRALTQASDYQIAKSEESIADAEARNASARRLPSFGAEAGVILNTPALAGPGPQAFVSENSVLWFRATVGATGRLGLSQEAEVRQGRALLAAAHAGTEQARQALAQATIDAFYGVSLAQAQLAAAQDNAATTDELVRVTAIRFAAEEVPEVDVVRTRLLAQTRHDELLQAGAGVDAARARLGLLVGPSEDWTVEGLDAPAAAAAEVDRLIGEVEGGAPSPEMAAAASRVEAARQGVAVARGALLPSLDYTVGLGVDTDSLGAALPQHLGLVAGLTITVPVFDWGIGSRTVDSAALASMQAETAHSQIVQAAKADVAITASQARNSVLRTQTLQASIADAERNVAISQARYAAGEADLLEVTEAEQTLASTRYALNSALADLADTVGHLRLLAGK